jgi:hypothetical protein
MIKQSTTAGEHVGELSCVKRAMTQFAVVSTALLPSRLARACAVLALR